MRRNTILAFLAATLVVMPCMAQKRKASTRKKTTPVAKVNENTKFEEMLNATQKVMFIDSVVVDKQDFLKAYQLTTDAGIVSTYNQFFNSSDQPYATVYVNQLGNKCWFSNDGRLYTSDKLDGQWSKATQLEGLGQFQRTNYPFVLPDGRTLYFAAICEEGLGGLDIYVSRYDSEADKFLLSENIGLPFNSEANDYMYAIDELNGIGYFATDRQQPEGKVCIYTFIPNDKRITYSDSNDDEEVIRSRARIDRIADTWDDGTLRNETLQRLQRLSEQKKNTKGNDFLFIVNDDITYTKPEQLKNATNRQQAKKLSDMQKKLMELGKEIDKMRLYYATKASADEKNTMHNEIQGYEKQYMQLKRDIKQLEKDIRRAELQ